MRVISISIDAGLAGRTAGTVLRRQLHMAKSLISRIKLREDGIRINGVRARTVDVLREGDTLSVRIDDPPQPDKVLFPAPEPAVVYEDEDLLVIDKPAGIAMHGDGSHDGVTVVDMLENHIGRVGIHLTNRLDRGTSGLLAAAKNAYAADRLRVGLHTAGGLRRIYLAVTEGVPGPAAGEISLPILKEEDSIKCRVSPDGRPALTRYEVLHAQDGRALVRLELLTGRTHQIRVHMSAAGCPLLGDWLYGSSSPLIARPALHSHAMYLRHPVTGRDIALRSPLPDDMAALFPDFNLHNF